VSYPRYPVEVTDNLFNYELYSEGPAGKIKKVISLERVAENLYNLAFGDWNKERQRVDDSTRSNDILGFRMENWEPFLPGRNYESVVARRK